MILTKRHMFTTLAIGGAAVLLIKFIQGAPFGVTASVQVLSILLSAGAGYVLGWFMSPQARIVRQILLLVWVLGMGLVALGDMGPMGAGFTGLAGWAGFWMALSYWFGRAVRQAMRDITFGSARWAEPDDLQTAGQIGQTGLRLGRMQDGPDTLPVQYAGDRHLLTVAPTRSGKGTSAIIPNLLTYAGSVLVIDPKGENAMIAATQRRHLGQTVHVIDPWGIVTGISASRFNPIDWVVHGGVEQTENAMLLADALVMREGQADPFWTEEAKALLQGLILYVATDAAEEGHRTLARVRDLLLLDGDDLQLLFQRMLDSDQHIVASTGARCAQKDEKLLSNVIASAQAQTHFLDSPRLRDSLGASDLSFADLKRTPMSVFLVLPADRLSAFSRWLRLLVQQAITENARDIATRPAKPVLFLLDEMAALGSLNMVEQAYGLMAGFGMQLWGIVQDLGQLRKIYGEGAYETLISNSGVVQYFGSRDKLTSEYFSALCGVTTVANLSTAIAHAVSSGWSGQSSNTSQSSTSTRTHSLTQRKLAFADELMRLPKGQQLLFIENQHPIRAIKTPWFADPALRPLGRDLRTDPPTLGHDGKPRPSYDPIFDGPLPPAHQAIIIRGQDITVAPYTHKGPFA